MITQEDEPAAEEQGGGYGRPPKGNQFRPGQSGNPHGRPAGSKSPKKMLTRLLAERIRVLRDGGETKLSSYEVMLEVCARKAAQGDRRAKRNLDRIRAHFGAPEAEDKTPSGGVLVVPKAEHRRESQARMREIIREVEESRGGPRRKDP